MKRLGSLRPHELVAIAYFCLTAVLALSRGIAPLLLLIASATPFVLTLLAYLEARYGGRTSHIAREWLSLSLILLAYWQVQWFAGPFSPTQESRFESWDRALFAALPNWPASVSTLSTGLMDVSYAILYALPILYLGILYARGRKGRSSRYLFTLFLGTFAAYAMLPYFPVRAPRIAFTSPLAPTVITVFGTWNSWVLDHFDISTSVFPSGHVAVAFSSAFGLLRAVPEDRLTWMAALAVALCVWAATIHARFHYAADGAASFLISFAAWRLSGRWEGCGWDA